jgi:hypothetical protein
MPGVGSTALLRYGCRIQDARCRIGRVWILATWYLAPVPHSHASNLNKALPWRAPRTFSKRRSILPVTRPSLLVTPSLHPFVPLSLPCIPVCGFFEDKRLVPGSRSRVPGTGPNRRRRPDTEHRGPSPATGKRAHGVCILERASCILPYLPLGRGSSDGHACRSWTPLLVHRAASGRYRALYGSPPRVDLSE